MYLAKINKILDYIFTGGLEMPNLMTGISSHASSHPYAYYIFASKSWDPEAPLRLLTSLTSDEILEELLAAPSSTQRYQICFFHLLLLFLPSSSFCT